MKEKCNVLMRRLSFNERALKSSHMFVAGKSLVEKKDHTLNLDITKTQLLGE